MSLRSGARPAVYYPFADVAPWAPLGRDPGPSERQTPGDSAAAGIPFPPDPDAPGTIPDRGAGATRFITRRIRTHASRREPRLL